MTSRQNHQEPLSGNRRMAQSKVRSTGMTRIVVITGDEPRHRYFRLLVASDPRVKVLASYCEVLDKEAATASESRNDATLLERLHFDTRAKSELEFFGELLDSMIDKSNPKRIKRGQINDAINVSEIENLEADLLVCYGSSLIKSSLLKTYKRKFLNVHLGLSPYYRGSGTNVWPLINCEPEYVGATYMHLDEGIDTGEIIHQIRADFVVGDSPHSIGNRLIAKMATTCCDVIASFSKLNSEIQPVGKGKLYFIKDFNSDACAKLYANFDDGLIAKYLENLGKIRLPIIVENKGL